MALALKIIGWWVFLSFTLGPCLTWLFSTASVKENTNKIVDDRSIARHRDRLRNLIEIRPYVGAALAAGLAELTQPRTRSEMALLGFSRSF
jgi:hypothetical protein